MSTPRVTVTMTLTEAQAYLHVAGEAFGELVDVCNDDKQMAAAAIRADEKFQKAIYAVKQSRARNTKIRAAQRDARNEKILKAARQSARECREQEENVVTPDSANRFLKAVFPEHCAAAAP